MKNKFRNHPSLILEQIGAFWGTIIFFLVLNFDFEEWKTALTDMKSSGLIVIGILLAIFLLRTAISAIRWYKTWITVDETSITISINTLNQSVNTIGLKNISNVTIERNIFEMLIGTSKIKIDTDSHSTAETTDVKIILKKNKAEQLRQYLMAGTNRNDENLTDDGKTRSESEVRADSQEPAPVYEVYYNIKNTIMHCIFTAPISGIVITLTGIVLFTVFFAQQLSSGGFSMQKLAVLFSEAVSAGIILLMLFFSAAYSLIKDFFKYYKFHAHRINNRIQIEFGLFKRNSYEIPINRINSIVIQKSVISRITHRSCVDLINVGIGDEKEESTRLLLSVNDKYLGEVLHRVLPEFDEYFQTTPGAEDIRPPKAIWWKHGFGACKILAIAMIAFVVAASFHLISGVFTALYWGSAIAIICFYLIGCYFAYRADRLQLHRNYLAISSGIFAMTTQFVKYSKIQHMELMQGPLERGLNLQRGVIYILASLQQNMISIPAFDKNQMEPIVRLFLEDGKNLDYKTP